MEEFEVLLVDRQVLAEGDSGGLGAADEAHPALRLAGRVVFRDDRLVVLEGVHSVKLSWQMISASRAMKACGSYPAFVGNIK